MYTPTKKEIEDFKAKHGRVFMAKSEDGNFAALLKVPGRKEISYATSAGTSDPFKVAETLINACWLAGDEEMRKEDKYFRGVSSQIDKLIEVESVSLEEL